ncbi:hypothetical protein CTA1_3131 [Colletotrichum tanaceti]|uniref:Heterokaryon incompatibility domain-containing protein n=1 Tax=Colletotrichum tanaceti TaxID=1306861 RepID=A0A4U6XVP5_9PEZI|nr:hypothetical protein CTA1_3131 [Colletotrichum tanaceti]
MGTLLSVPASSRLAVMGDETEYGYKPVGDDQIRLIKFLHDGDDAVAADLFIFTLDDSMPAYQSLSYTWMLDQYDFAKTHALAIGDQRLPILGSVHTFMQALQSRGMLLDGTWWWIDSICINQRDLEEQNQQVRLMQQIYRRACKAVVWLSEQSHDSDLAVEFIRALDKIKLQGHSDVGIRPVLDRFRGHDAQWEALKNFFLRKWWTRRVPMVRRAKRQPDSATVVCRALWAADKCPWSGFKETPGFTYGFNRRRLWMLYKIAKSNNRPGREMSLSLPALAAYFSHCDATDDRDRLYGLRALSTDGSLLRDVYLHYTWAFIEHHKSLDIICFASVYNDDGSSSSSSSSNNGSKISSLPSWVHDWRLGMNTLVAPLMASQGSKTHIGNMRPPLSLENTGEPAVYSASGGREAEYAFEGRALLTRGTILRKICKALVLDRENRYLQYAAPEEAFFDDFIRLCELRLEDSLDLVADEFKEWFEWTRRLLIHKQTFKSITRNSVEARRRDDVGQDGDMPVRPLPNQAEFVHDSVFGRLVDTVGRMSLRLMVGCDGHIGLAPKRARKGDLMCVLFGCSIPVVLRRCEAGDGVVDGFVVIGECFVDSYMEGAGAELGSALERTFLLI